VQTAENIIQYPLDKTSPKVLVVDDSKTNRQILKTILKDHGYRVATARNGHEAVEAVAVAHPDIVLMDINMPLMNGYEAVRRIKQGAGQAVIPVMFVTSLTDDASLATCLDSGGDDFITFPINETILMARIHALLRNRERARRLIEQEKQLSRYEDMVAREQEVATSIFRAVMKRDELDAENIRYSISPMAVFNGDLLLGARTPNGDLQILLGDFTGHGLGASIGSLPTSEIFHAMAAKGFGIVDIMAEINRRLHSLMPTGMFLVAAGIEISARTGSAMVWAGGVPDILIRRFGSGSIEHIAARHLPLGIGGDELFERSFDMLALEPGDRLYMLTDGVTEAENASGEMFGIGRLKQSIGEHADPDGIFDRVMTNLETFRAGHAQNDDVTLLEYVCNPGLEHRISQRLRIGAGSRRQVSTEWHIDMHLNAEALRDFDPRPVVTQLVMDVQGLYNHRERLFTILAELFSNALDHGVLGLDSAMKRSSEGFSEYYRLRAERLAGLADGWVDISLNHQPSMDGGQLNIQISDSGAGFDPKILEQATDRVCHDNAELFCGRGFSLLRQLCDNIIVHPPGNLTEAAYAWRHDNEHANPHPGE